MTLFLLLSASAYLNAQDVHEQSHLESQITEARNTYVDTQKKLNHAKGAGSCKKHCKSHKHSQLTDEQRAELDAQQVVLDENFALVEQMRNLKFQQQQDRKQRCDAQMDAFHAAVIKASAAISEIKAARK